MSAHIDGSYTVWSSSDSTNPKEAALTPYGNTNKEKKWWNINTHTQEQIRSETIQQDIVTVWHKHSILYSIY